MKQKPRNRKPKPANRHAVIVFSALTVAIITGSLIFLSQAYNFSPVVYLSGTDTSTSTVSDTIAAVTATSTSTIAAASTTTEPVFVPIRLETPESVRAIYMSQCVAGTPSFRDKLIKLAEETEINSIIIDVKDYSGGLGFIPESESLQPYLSTKCYAPDMKELVKRMNEKGIYTIARITVFQDPLYTSKFPEHAVQKESDKSTWQDYKGLSFIDVGAKPAWEHIVDISKETYDVGFDELNFDYIRYPSDGPMKDIYFPHSNERVVNNWRNGKAEVLEEFFAYLHNELEPIGIPTSADLFGMVTTNTDDLNIGQQLERALPYFDYIAPMVYPSHFPRGFNGWPNPNDEVYGVINFSMSRGAERVTASTTVVSTMMSSSSLSTSTNIFAKEVYPATVLRPWLQDFDYGGEYGPEEVRDQIQAAYDAGLTSWMLWDPANIYTREALYGPSGEAPEAEGDVEIVSATSSATTTVGG